MADTGNTRNKTKSDGEREDRPAGNVADRGDYDRAGGGGVIDQGAGSPGGTLGTGDAGREQDR